MKTPRNVHVWLPGYLRWQLGAFLQPDQHPKHVWLTIADHYEPLAGGSDVDKASECVAEWRRVWPEIASRHRDSTGAPPRYTFFYPQEDYRPQLIEPLAEMARMGMADVEIHIHHDGEGEQNFVDRMERFKEELVSGHALLHRQDGRVVFGFIHGNWALDNSRPDGRYCGLNNELILLRDLGCYADFTLPSVPWPTQTSTVNTIYWATDDPTKPKSHDRGMPVLPGGKARGDLLMIPGPLGLRFGGRLLPRIETGEIAGYDMPSRARARGWLKVGPRIGANLFIKLYTHGAQERNMKPLLGGGLDRLFDAIEAECEAAGSVLHYATAWELFQAVVSASAGN